MRDGQRGYDATPAYRWHIRVYTTHCKVKRDMRRKQFWGIANALHGVTPKPNNPIKLSRSKKQVMQNEVFFVMQKSGLSR